ncbi:ROK family protein [Hymenobacter sp. M29]|uniref:ROK family protein n=1 Tax=Hymenobacter mellowenesis TaxID=3063995 RepID=A0ABT9AB76_9BACT|nr:ROK family protein [Hymenobacter sp. M29]MDO7846246.1 ROK family protein [Hymenobacter sp. M29]
MSTFNSNENLWGCNLGNNTIEGVILKSAREPETLFSLQIPTESDLGYEHVLERVKTLLNEMQAAAGYQPARLGLATPGTLVTRTGLLKNTNIACLEGQPLAADLAARLGVQTTVGNDANCLTLGETRLGVVAERFPDAKIVFGILMDRGIGGGLVVNGQIVRGNNGITGEWGHIYLNPAEPHPCFCGKRGCIESILSVPALERFYKEICGTPRPLAEIEDRAEAGDSAARATLQRLTNFFGHALSILVNVLDPDVIVIGGQTSTINRLYTDGPHVIASYVIDHHFETPVVQAKLGDLAVAYGAALLLA